MDLLLIYNKLFSLYGPMGWWPLSSSNATENGYHPGDYSLPKTIEDRWEIYVGAILTQNTAWKNVRIAINNLIAAKALSPEATIQLFQNNLAELIKPSGYYNQKAKKLQFAADFFIKYEKRKEIPTRDALLSIWGVGEETADAIRLYAYHQPEFVVDTYTKRIFTSLGYLKGDEKYSDIKKLFEDNLPKETTLFKEFHALIVKHAKEFYSKKPFGVGDQLLNGKG